MEPLIPHAVCAACRSPLYFALPMLPLCPTCDAVKFARQMHLVLGGASSFPEHVLVFENRCDVCKRVRRCARAAIRELTDPPTQLQRPTDYHQRCSDCMTLLLVEAYARPADIYFEELDPADRHRTVYVRLDMHAR